MNAFEWSEPGSIEQALAQGSSTAAEAAVHPAGNRTPARDAALFKAGGVDLLDLMKERIIAPTRLVSLRALPGLDQIKEEAGLRIGPLVTLDQLDNNALVRKNYTALADAAGHSATPQIRNAATIGGNLMQRPRCWYFRHDHFHCLKKGGTSCFALEGEHQYHAIIGNQKCPMVHRLDRCDCARRLSGAAHHYRTERLAGNRARRILRHAGEGCDAREFAPGAAS